MGKIKHCLKPMTTVRSDKYQCTATKVSLDEVNAVSKSNKYVNNDNSTDSTAACFKHEDEEDAVDDMLDEEKQAKHIRRRKRKLYNQVRDQMEFYFSDANLSKDRYLMQLIREDPYVPLEVFLGFNKIKKILKTPNELIKALSSSTLLELNENETRVGRIRPFKDVDEKNLEDIDGRTLYVESLPANADHDWVKKIFTHASNGGKIAYVSLPRYKNSKKLKEFGFVEFEAVGNVTKCIKTFEEFGGVLEVFDPIDLCSIKSFIEENNCSDEANEGKADKKERTNDVKRYFDVDGETEPMPKRIKLNCEQERDDVYTDRANKIEPEINDSQDSEAGSYEMATESDTHEPNDDSDLVKRKKIRKKKRKDKRRKTIENPVTSSESRPLNLDIDMKELRILPKRDWKRLRNKYLNLQREKINALKKKSWQKNNENVKGNLYKKQKAAVKHIGRLNQQIAASTSLQQQTQVSSSMLSKPSQIIINVTAQATTTTVTTDLASSQPVTQSSTNLSVTNVKNYELKKSPHMNFYRVNKEIDGGLYEEDENDSQSNDTSSLDSHVINSPYSMLEKCRKLLSPITNSTKTEIKRNIALERRPLFQFEPGIIVKLVLSEACVTLKKFKTDLKQHNCIKYVDVKEGSLNIHLRCDTPKNAEQLVQKLSVVSVKDYQHIEILDGTEESKYWAKIMEDRDMKLNKRIKIKTKRGREKVPKLIANHIRFNDDED